MILSKCKKDEILPIMTKFEKTSIIGKRAEQLRRGDKPYYDTSKEKFDPLSIAEKELELKLIPFIIKRKLPDGSTISIRAEDLIQLS
jgi:DNA-directed RNA polymerase subunit K/omega